MSDSVPQVVSAATAAEKAIQAARRAELLARHIEEQKSALRALYHQPVVRTHWDTTRHVYQAWMGTGPFDTAEKRAEWGTTEAGALRRLRNQHVRPLTHSLPPPEASAQESRPSPSMHVADVMASRHRAAQRGGQGIARGVIWFLVVVVVTLLVAVTLLLMRDRVHVTLSPVVPTAAVVQPVQPLPPVQQVDPEPATPHARLRR